MDKPEKTRREVLKRMKELLNEMGLQQTEDLVLAWFMGVVIGILFMLWIIS